MPRKSLPDTDRVTKARQQCRDLDPDERKLVRSILRKTTYLELNLLLSDPDSADRGRSDREPARRLLTDPKIIAFAVLALIALAALAATLAT
jgi:hypothetical protein